MGVINPHASLVFHDPTSRDLNQYRNVDRREKHRLIDEYLAKWAGTLMHVVNTESGEVYVWDLGRDPWGKPTRRARVSVVHLLFGNYRVATPEDIARQDKKDAIKAEAAARIEANRSAGKANIMFTELARAADAISTFQRMKEKEAASASAAEEEKSEAKGKKKAANAVA